MLRTICICIVIFFSNTLISQSVDSIATVKSPRLIQQVFHEIGINGTSILSQFLNISDKEIIESPYLLTYKIGIKKHALRFGIGGNWGDREECIGGTTDKIITINYDLDWRVGYEFRTYFGSRWIGTFGLDFISRSIENEIISETSFDRVTILEKSIGNGFGLAIGLQYHLTKRLLLGTEGAFYLLNSEYIKDTIFENNNTTPVDLEFLKERTTLIYLPSTIYIIFHF